MSMRVTRGTSTRIGQPVGPLRRVIVPGPSPDGSTPDIGKSHVQFTGVGELATHPSDRPLAKSVIERRGEAGKPAEARDPDAKMTLRVYTLNGQGDITSDTGVYGFEGGETGTATRQEYEPCACFLYTRQRATR